MMAKTTTYKLTPANVYRVLEQAGYSHRNFHGWYTRGVVGAVSLQHASGDTIKCCDAAVGYAKALREYGWSVEVSTFSGQLTIKAD